MLNETLKISRKKIKSAHRALVLLVLLISATVIGLSVLIAIAVSSQSESHVIAPKTTMPVELATTPDERRKGLSGRASLEQGTGLLFVFEEASIQCFWMKDMAFAIDMVWVNPDGAVVKVVERAQPSSYPTSFCPADPALYVLEVNAGEARSAGIQEGVQLRLQIK